MTKLTVLALLVPAFAACHHRGDTAVPVGMTVAPTQGIPLTTLMWIGRGEAELLDAGVWQRAPAFDYEFSVEQRRFADHWDSVKTMRRAHPAYDGSAGPRVQVYMFHLRVDAQAPDRVGYRIDSSLGVGTGSGDREFRMAVLEIKAEVSPFAPFDRYRITQEYKYEAGQLRELVELNKGTSPWVRNHEVAVLFGPRTYPQPPTTLSER